NTASANGKIVLSFNEQVQAGTGEIEFNGSAIEPIFGSSTASFEYKGLEYNTSYTFTVPAGAITDRAGNPFEGVTLNFTTMNRPQPIARVFDAVVAADKTGDYESVQAAIDAAPKNRTTPYLIFIKNGSYEEQVVIPSDKPNIHLIGQDKEKTNIHLKINVQSEPQEGSQWYQNDTAAWKYSVHNPESPTYQMEGTVVRINSNDFFSENISFINDWGVERQNGPQSLAMMTKGDRITFHNCKFRSYQDTWMTPGNTGYRHYVKGCYIEGAVDYVYGAGDCLFEDCTLYNVRSGSVITAPEHEKGTQWGYVFDHCTIDGNEASNDGKNKLGRPWHNNPICVWLNTTMKVGIAPEGWSEMGGIPALFAEYNSMDIDGNPVDLNNRRTFYTGTDEGMEEGGECKAELSADEAARYTYENIVSGNDNWNPRSLIEAIGIPQNVTISENVLSWEAVPYAICYVILRNNEVIGFTTETSYTDAASKDNDEYCIQAVNEAGSLGEKSENVNKGTSAVDKSEKSSFNVTVSNGKIHLSGLSSGEKITVFSLNGAIIYDTVTIENSCFINLSVRGVYLIKAGNEIKKVIL
ncbi:pectinesterase family protein, partial [Coprobacter fastidiosus]